MPTTRRRFIFAAAMGALGVAAGSALIGLLWRRTDESDERIVSIPVGELPGPSEVVSVDNGRGFIVGLPATNESPGGLLAVSARCPHLACRVRWEAGEPENAQTEPAHNFGRFFCPCHDSVFNAAGIRYSGPSPRPLDTIDVKFSSTGAFAQIALRDVREGGEDNPQRATPWPAS